MTTSCWRPADTCSTLTLASSWGTHRCLATSNGRNTKRPWKGIPLPQILITVTVVSQNNVDNLQQPVSYCFSTKDQKNVFELNQIWGFDGKCQQILIFCFYRDRAPFVFTSDMAYVINGGDKPSSRFHDFVDLCCEAYNLIRKHAHLFLNLLGLVSSHTFLSLYF